MPNNQIPYVTPESDHSGGHLLRRNLLRSTVPLAFVVLILGAILSIAYYSYQSNRSAVLMLSSDLLNTLDQRIHKEVEDYLFPAVNMAEILGRFIKDDTFLTARFQETDSLATGIIQAYPQLANVPIADTHGNFLMPKRMPDGSIHTKRIEWHDTRPVVTWIRRDLQGRVTGIERTVDGSYDPRLRPWYTGAIKRGGLFWTDMYIFFTDKKPGITASYPIRGPDGRILGALGVDFTLFKLSQFLKGLRIGKTGIAVIINSEGEIIAHPDATRMTISDQGKLRPMTIRELGDPVLARAFNHYRIFGYGQHTFKLSDTPYISVLSGLPKAIGKEWSVLIVVPEADFVGSITTNNRNTLILSLGIVAISAILAILFAMQSWRADRNAKMVSEWQHQLEVQSFAFSRLTGKPAIFDPEQPEGTQQITEIAAEVFDVARVGIWRLMKEGDVLVAEDIYSSENKGHTRGLELRREHYPRFLDAVQSDVFLIITDALEDLRTADLKETYLKTLGTVSMLIAPLHMEDRVCGVLTFERVDKRSWSPEEMNFAETIAGVVSTRISFGEHDRKMRPPPGEVHHDHVQEPKRGEGDRVSAKAANGVGKPSEPSPKGASARLQERKSEPVFGVGLPLERIRSERGPSNRDQAFEGTREVTILVAELRANRVISESESIDRAVGLIRRITEVIGSLAQGHGISMQKMMGDIYTCIAHGSGAGTKHAQAIAEMAMDMQHRLARLFDEASLPMWARFGVSSGPIILQTTQEGELVNFWGEAANTATMMAAYGVRGEIQVSESSYELLKTDFLLQDRGSFFVEGQGEINTFLLSGKL